MDFLHFVLLSALIPFAYSQRPDNDGNDIDNDQDLDINAFGNVITPIKGNKLIKKNNDNKIFHIYLGEYEDEMLIVSDSMPETMGNLIGLAGLGSNIEMSSSVTCINQEVIIKRFRLQSTHFICNESRARLTVQWHAPAVWQDSREGCVCFKDFDGPKGYAYMSCWFIYENEALTKVFFDPKADDASP